MNGPLGAGRICIKMAPALRSSAEISAKGSAGIIICQGRRRESKTISAIQGQGPVSSPAPERKNLIYVSEDARGRGRF